MVEYDLGPHGVQQFIEAFGGKALEKGVGVPFAAHTVHNLSLIHIYTYGMGYFGVESAYKLLAGQGSSVEKSNITATRTITRENMFAIDKQKALFPFG